MRANGWKGVVRRRTIRTTESDPAGQRAADLVDRNFRVPAPNLLVVADFTYVRLASGGFVYTAFVVDAYAGRIVGWECSTSKRTAFVESAIRQAAALRVRQGRAWTGFTIHHSDAGSQYTSVKVVEILMLSGLRPSICSVGDAYDNALAETTIGLFEADAVRDDSPFRRGPLNRLADVELLTHEWVSWFNNHPVDAPARSPNTERVRSRLLFDLLRATGWRQITECAPNPGRFSPRDPAPNRQSFPVVSARGALDQPGVERDRNACAAIDEIGPSSALGPVRRGDLVVGGAGCRCLLIVVGDV